MHFEAIMLRNSKEFLEGVKEIEEHKVLVQTNLDFFWELIEQVEVIFQDEGLVVVMSPLVLEVTFDAFLQVVVNPLLVIELLDCAKELCQVLGVFEVSSDTSE